MTSTILFVKGSSSANNFLNINPLWCETDVGVESSWWRLLSKHEYYLHSRWSYLMDGILDRTIYKVRSWIIHSSETLSNTKVPRRNDGIKASDRGSQISTFKFAYTVRTKVLQQLNLTLLTDIIETGSCSIWSFEFEVYSILEFRFVRVEYYSIPTVSITILECSCCGQADLNLYNDLQL